MKCDKVKKIIYDYIDGELSQDNRKAVAEHIASCVECGKFEASIREAVIKPFEKAERVQPPEEVWSNIKEVITKEKISYLEIIKNNIEFIFARHKLALATVSATVAIVCFMVLANIYTKREDPVNSFLNEQVNYLVALGANGESETGIGEVDFGTDIEKYLL